LVTSWLSLRCDDLQVEKAVASLALEVPVAKSGLRDGVDNIGELTLL